MGNDLSDDWIRGVVSLHFQVGELTLWSKRFAGVVDARHFSEIARAYALPDPGYVPAGPGEVVLFPSYPIAFRPRALVVHGPWIAYTPERFTHYYVDLARFGSFEAYLRHFSARSRGTLRRKVRHYLEANDGELAWRRFARPEDVDEFFGEAVGISAKTYQERVSQTGLPHSPGFVTETKKGVAAGHVVGYVLYLHGRPVAYQLCRIRRGIVAYEHVGYDPGEARLSPGIVLHYVVLQSLFAQRDARIFDFAPGMGEHKRFFASDGVPCATTYLFPRTARHALVVAAHLAFSRSVRAAGATLDRVGLKVRARRAIRRLDLRRRA